MIFVPRMFFCELLNICIHGPPMLEEGGRGGEKNAPEDPWFRGECGKKGDFKLYNIPLQKYIIPLLGAQWVSLALSRNKNKGIKLSQI